MAKYIKGQSGNLNGRPKGAPNKVTGDMRDLAMQFSKDNWETIQDDFNKLKAPKDKLFFRLAMLEFAIGKMQRVEMKAEISAEIVQTVYKISEGVEISI